MNKIVTFNQTKTISNTLHRKGKTIVLVGGCFDILHIGHVLFLEKAKEKGDVLIIMLESDEHIKALKGKDRPFHAQGARAQVLASLWCVDYILLLPTLKKDSEYDIIVSEIKPDIIAITKGDPSMIHKKRQAYQTGAKLEEVIAKVKDASTSRLAKRLATEL